MRLLSKEGSIRIIETKTNKKYKDSIFRRLFGENRENALSLYNALNGTSYTNVEDLEYTTLEDVVYIKMKNDVSFLLGTSLSLYEHQSTYNPNMPLRGLCSKFERGEASVIAGKSGVEIAFEVLRLDPVDDDLREEYVVMHRSAEYWLGWSLAYYQWHSGLGFSEIVKCIPIEDIRDMYSKYHEMDIRQFAERMDEICHMQRMETRLKTYRTLIGLSQRELAEKTDIPVRTIQQYEQRQKNINKAQATYLIKLSKALYCEPEDLFENIG